MTSHPTATYSIIAHLTGRTVDTGLSADAVTAYLSNQIDTSRYTVVYEGDDVAQDSGDYWMHRIVDPVSALSFDGERIVSDDAREDELYGYETDDFAHVEDDGNDAPPEVGYYDDGEWIEGAPLNDTPEWAYTYDPIDAGKPEPDICGTLAARFDGIMGAASTPITDLKVGDWFVHLIAVEQVIKITSSAVVSTEAQHELFWKASVQRISDDDAAFIRVNWDGWRVWMIAGADGLRKTLRKPEPVHHIARPHVPADDITTILTPALAAHLAAIGSTYDRLTSGDITPAQANAEAAARMTARKLAGK